MKASTIKTISLITIAFVSLFIHGFAQKTSTAKSVTVYVFLSETCPICQNYTLTLKQLYSQYKDKHIAIIGVFPNYYSTQESIDEFKKQYSIPFPLLLDKKAVFTNHFKASITPEVFIENADKKILYAGRIDDSFYAIGKRRNVITSTELADALEAIAAGKPIKTTTAQAVGCVITSSK